MASRQLNQSPLVPKSGWQRLLRDIRMDWMLYLMFLPGLAYIIIFHYAPMYGISIAFKDYRPVLTIASAEWVGLENFEKLFKARAFKRALSNNITISVLKLLTGFPVPIILSLMINELRSAKYKKVIQTSVILPNFISWIILSGVFFALFNLTSGAIPGFLRSIGYQGKIVNIMSDKKTILPFVLISHIWQASGMGTIVYLAAIVGIDQEMYEAAMIDGAGRWKQLWHITLSSLRSTIIVLLIFRVGNVMSAGFDQVFALSNDLIVSEIDIIDTYVYRIGMEEAKFSRATAAGLFKSLIGLFLVLTTNYIAKKVDPESGIM